MSDALGLATSMSGGLLAFLADGGWSKWLHTGWAAHGGLVAADLASHGFRGPHHALDHRYGLYGAFLGAPEADLGALTAGLGQTWLGSSARAKRFPCAHVIEPYVEAALAWRASGRVDLATLRPETRERSDIRALAACVTCDGDATLGAGFDGRIEATTTGGDRIHADVALSAASEERIVAKFRTNTAHLAHTACAELEAALLQGKPTSRTLVRLAATAMTRGKGARLESP
jgi:hypothetical protein